MEPGNRLVLALGLAISSAILAVILFAESQVREIEENIIATKNAEVDILASRTIAKIDDASTILQIVSELPALENNINPNLIDASIHGIPEASNPEKREIAKSVLEKYSDFVSIALLLANGDVYFVEPYSAQLNLVNTNFSFRDYYKGVIENESQYLGDTIISQATGTKVAALATPITDEDEIDAILVGALDLSVLDTALDTYGHNRSRYVLADHNGNIVATSEDRPELSLDSYVGLSSFSTSLNNSGGYYTEDVNGVKTFTATRTIPLLSNTWVIMSMQPYEEVFSPVSVLRTQVIAMTAIIITVGSAFGLFMHKTFISTRKLTKHLSAANSELKNRELALEKMNDELVQVEKSKSEFISMVSHELKNPLTPIIAFTDILKNQTTSGRQLTERQLATIPVINQNAREMKRLIEDIHSVYKLDMHLQFAFGETKIVELVDQVHLELSSMLSDKGIEVEKHFLLPEGKETTIICDALRIKQLLVNLIRNAVDFLPTFGGKIIINLENPEKDLKQSKDRSLSDIMISVADNGPGVPADKVSGLFRKFYQVDPKATRKHGGTGLGLAICKEIAEKHGGRIWYDSTYASGACFRCLLPVQPPEDTMKASLESNAISVTPVDYVKERTG